MEMSMVFYFISVLGGVQIVIFFHDMCSQACICIVLLVMGSHPWAFNIQSLSSST
jgi:lipid-A-disaccharide synthase-like uncharacterized protein